MYGMRKWGVGIIVAFAALGTTSVQVQAQTEQVASNGIEADQLEKEAAGLMADLTNIRRAEKLYRKAADLRGDHPAAVRSRIMAGQLSFYNGNKTQAVKDLTKAGETALQWGDVVTAAKSFLDAAWVAEKNGRGTLAIELVTRAQRLARSPLMEQSDRSRIESRITQEE